ncbi:ferredoxin [Pseudonocardia thermophila]|jgi:Ferredoxin|uniref:ferredoxin n=1 Tax=Pseudonocardia thermophila TaxID=1848 RepID=UPI00248E2592|nr:ferredoxin [Pseudonocardia thermophila]
MKVFVDSTRCSGYGTCAEHCPSVFSLDEWGYAAAISEDVPAGAEEQVRIAAQDCPEQAIRYED